MSDARNTSLARSTPALSELAALLLVPAASVGFIRIFEQTTDIVPILLAGLGSSLFALAMRYARVPLFIAGPLSLIALGVGLLNWLAPGTASFGVIPTIETREALQLVSDEAMEQFRSQRAPVDAISGFVAAAAAGAWISAFIVDWAAMRLRLAFEPVLPAGLLFVFSAVIGSGQYRILSTLIFGAAVILWTVAHRLSRERLNLWLTADRRRGPSRIASGAALFGAAAVALGVVAGPLLPGANETELLDWRNSGDPTRVVISPYVSIQSRLVTQTDVELFKVTSERPSYYRLAGLDTYENGRWVAKGQEQSEEDGRLPGLRPSAGTTQSVTQTFELQNLGGDWLPAAFAPTRIEAGTKVNWIGESGSLIVLEGSGEAEDLEYTVESLVPLYTADELRRASTEGTQGIRRRYLDVPDEVSPVVAQTARQITEGAATDYDRLILLQTYFRGFDYSVSLSPRNNDDPHGQFLAERVGFCQQFSDTFALMARSLGIPSRVAVGFTWGSPVAGEPNTWQVTGRHTHAWPEAYFDDLGWVAFEPTPQRGSPSGTGYTNVDAQQDEPTQPNFDSTTTTTPLDQPESELPQNSIPTDGPEIALEPVASGTTQTTIGLRWILGPLALLGIVFGLPAVRRARLARRRSSAVSTAQRVDTAWAEVAEALEHHHGLLRGPSETRTDFGARLVQQSQFAHLPVDSLGQLANAARYAPDLVTEAQAKAAEAASDTIVTEFRAEKSVLGRWWYDADPRRLLKPTHRVTVK